MDINNMDQEIAHHAAHAVEVCQGKTVSKLDFSPDSLEPLQQYIVEASAGFAAMSDEQKSALVADLGSYVLEVARRNVGGAYAWFTKREQPVLVVGEPNYRVIFVAWDKVSSRLAGDVGAKIPFHYRLLLHHISQAKKDTSVLCV
ncbi:MAG TPA: hypothetical protein VHD76_22865 [Bryobacteraceae bacterium]|nr:hypothetical protein [Bryobacteraceae bacterium]